MQILDKIIESDPTVWGLFLKMSDKTVRINITDIKLNFDLLFAAKSVKICSNTISKADLELTGTLIQFQNLVFNKHIHGLAVSGDITLAQYLQKITTELTIDWAWLAGQIIPDYIAYGLVNFTRQIGQSWWQHKKNLLNMFAEYTIYEREILPSRQEVEVFCNEVDHLASRMENLIINAQSKKISSYSGASINV